MYRLFGKDRCYSQLRNVIDAARAAGETGYLKLCGKNWEWRAIDERHAQSLAAEIERSSVGIALTA